MKNEMAKDNINSGIYVENCIELNSPDGLLSPSGPG
jgi:hypothetical protein